ncbi:MAG TPA: hypothetical protein VKH43_06905 [Thermoanaerobaculia bacterium]|nr:hypothetical protein [Thermoanaerobaculia bacterium]
MSWQPLLADAGPVVINPLNPSTLYLGASPGIRRSDDGGTSWTPPSGPPFSQDLAIDPTNPSNLYAAAQNSGVSRSADEGRTWIPASTGIDDGGTKEISATSIAIDPKDPAVLYAAAGPRSNAEARSLYKTVDSAATWRPIAALPDGKILQVRVALGSPTAVYCLNQTGDGARLFRSLDQGESWVDVTGNLGSPTLFEISPGDPATVYAATDAGLFATTFPTRAESPPRAPRTHPFRR